MRICPVSTSWLTKVTSQALLSRSTFDAEIHRCGNLWITELYELFILKYVNVQCGAWVVHTSPFKGAEVCRSLYTTKLF